ncbi:hypothetical protein Dda_5243 [Drechslerella dactyloides]|uniref:Uncharacterized protein n=1 Tax=Drechslerella dactyloides TaxID=74499 RepID=A0AAD6IXX5_DREDA|nr:hypothetical protein Dda_5243 [Drechslerella dactyloides]
MVHVTFTQLLVLVSAAKMAAAVQPLAVGSLARPMTLVKRQSVCVGPVVCERTADSCRSCEAGYYCVAGGGCCENGQVCSGFRPCANAGTPDTDPDVDVCPTEAPLCTTRDGVPTCAGTIQDWITISQALNGAATTSAAPTIASEATSTAEAETSTVYPPVDTPTYPTTEVTSVPTYAPPPPPSATTGYVPPPVSNTTVPEPPVATGAGARTQVGLGVVAGSFLLALLAL